MGRTNATIDADETEPDKQGAAVDRTVSPTLAGTAAATIAATRPSPGDSTEPRTNTLTIIGRDNPSSFEITVDGEIDLLTDDNDANATVVSGSTVEGTIETGIVRFRFTGDLTDVTFVDRGITGFSPAAAPNVHVDYPAPEQSRS
ncbi:hypothetical protein [Natronorubrum tibetense]|uniref:Uncharacterized protein n=1 Tax=Natronorubrum tibetense GA33 TaxID=1114856 RepID=L9VPU2_9EURY|nr:hypothetical protein [Natronorubrum tibetense]ELY39235.1 hypothetical protein C496_15297 [Natronorubrum tibetense GA33]